MISMKKMKETFKNPKFKEEFNETKEAVKHARTTRNYNKILSSVIISCVKLLKKKDIKEITFEYEGKKHTSSVNEILSDIEEMKKDGHA